MVSRCLLKRGIGIPASKLNDCEWFRVKPRPAEGRGRDQDVCSLAAGSVSLNHDADAGTGGTGRVPALAVVDPDQFFWYRKPLMVTDLLSSDRVPVPR